VGGYSQSELKESRKIKVSYCWAHVRRKFHDIQSNYPKESREILELIDQLFAIERKANDWEGLKRLRQEESHPLIDIIYKWLIEKKTMHLPGSGFTKAIKYAMKLWNGLTLFLDDIRVPLSNNDVERAIRHGVMGRKNFYGSKTINGADVTATLYTIIESCKRVELSPKKYMRYVISKNHRSEEPLTPLEYAKSIRTQ